MHRAGPGDRRGAREALTGGRITGVGGVFFKARDHDELCAWYRERLGVPLEPEGWHPFEWALPGSTTFAVFSPETSYLGDGEFMINFRVDDLDVLLARLRAECITVDDRVEETENGRFGWVVDPEGNRVELWQPATGQ